MTDPFAPFGERLGPRYYDRDGRPMAMMEWAQRFEIGCQVAKTDLPNGKLVSTVWLGLDHSHGSGPPLIFETMVFQDGESLDMERYSTEADAKAGHDAMVTKWSAT